MRTEEEIKRIINNRINVWQTNMQVTNNDIVKTNLISEAHDNQDYFSVIDSYESLQQIEIRLSELRELLKEIETNDIPA